MCNESFSYLTLLFWESRVPQSSWLEEKSSRSRVLSLLTGTAVWVGAGTAVSVAERRVAVFVGRGVFVALFRNGTLFLLRARTAKPATANNTQAPARQPTIQPTGVLDLVSAFLVGVGFTSRGLT